MSVRVAEANLTTAMKFVFDEFIAPLDTENRLDYRPKTKDDEAWLRDNKASGLIFLKKHKTLKEAWVIVRFESRTTNKFGRHAKYDNNIKITTPQEFEEYFGVLPGADFNWANDLTVYVKSGKRIEDNKFAYRDFDETSPNFYMYTNHIKVNLDKLVKRLYRLEEIVETNPKAIVGNVFNIPKTITDIK